MSYELTDSGKTMKRLFDQKKEKSWLLTSMKKAPFTTCQIIVRTFLMLLNHVDKEWLSFD